MNETAAKVLEQETLHPGDFSKIADLVRGDNYRFRNTDQNIIKK